MTQETLNDYYKRINRVLIYIENHLDEKLDINTLADISNFSPYHFHRIIRAHLNESLGAHIQRVRIETAAHLLRYTKDTISDIAYKIGYETPSSFNKAFKKRFSISPQEYRNGEEILVNQNHMYNYKKLSDMKLEPKIKNEKTKKVIFIQSIGPYDGEKTGETWNKLWNFMKQKKLFSWNMESFGVSHDNPDVTDEQKCRYDACITIKKEIKPEGEVGVKELEGGKFAIFLYKGPYTELGHAYNTIFREWYPDSGYKLRNIPIREKYLNNPYKTRPEKLKTEIYIPIE